MSKLHINLIALILFVNSSTSHAQTLYRFTSHEMWNEDGLGDKYNIKELEGTQLFQFIKIEPKKYIEGKFVDEEGTYKKLWNNDDISVVDKNLYRYNWLNTYPKDKENGISITLFMETETDLLFRVLIYISKNGVKVGTYLYPVVQ